MSGVSHVHNCLRYLRRTRVAENPHQHPEHLYEQTTHELSVVHADTRLRSRIVALHMCGTCVLPERVNVVETRCIRTKQIPKLSPGRFREGLARVRTGGRWGFIDATGRMVIPARFESAEDFRDGVALVEAPSSTLNSWGTFSKPVFIDRTGKPIVEAGLPTWLKCGSAPEDLGRF